MRRLHAPRQRRIAAQHEEGRFGKQRPIVAAQVRIRLEMARDHDVGRTVESQYPRQQLREMIDHE